jgi:DNA-binding response OmpR family regulator
LKAGVGTLHRVSTATVLVVDDDPAILRLLEVTFNLEGYQVLKASDGPTCLATVEDQHPDMVVVDVMMPGMSGLDVAARLRELPAAQRPSVVLLSAKAQASDVTAGLLVADDYVTKPFDPTHLLSRAAALLGNRRAEDA